MPDEVRMSRNVELPDFKFEDEADTTDETTDEESPEETPESEDVSTDDEDSEDLEEDSEEEDDDTDDEEDGDDEAGEEEEEDSDEDEESDDEDEEDSDEEDESFLPDFDRKEIEKNPTLKAAYKHMQRAFTKKMQAVSVEQKETAQAQEELQEFVATLKDDSGAEDFLLRLALGRPEVFQKAMERFQEFTEDPEALKQYLKDAQLTDREKKITKQEKMTVAEKQQARAKEVVTLTTSTATEFGLSGRALAIAEQYVVAKINENAAKTGKKVISDDEVVQAVRAAARDLGSEKEKTTKLTEKKARLKGKDKAKKLAKQAKKPRPPKAKSGAPRKAPGAAPSGVDPLDHLVDSYLGLVKK